jgi:CPA1 family monovalent cation:H+ antiporter
MIATAIGKVAIDEGLESFLLVLCVSLTVATLPRIFNWFPRIPYTLMLVIVGLGLALLEVRLVDLSPELILSIFLPPLLFEAAWNLKWSNLQQEATPILLYALLGVVISIAGITWGLAQLSSLSIAAALLVGACLSATDPVSVVALFREVGVDKQLSAVMEGESLVNDGMAVVAFSVLVDLVMGGAEVAVQPVLLQLVTVLGVGVGMGLLLGFAISYLTQRFDLPLVEQSLTLVAAYGAYLIAEQLGGSGVIATVTTGLILGNFGSRIGMNPRTRVIVTEFWEFLSFFVNSIVFLLIGDQVQFSALGRNWQAIAITVIAMLVSRALFIYGLGFLSNRLANSQLTVAEQTVLWWGGLRGSVSIALALSVPVLLPVRSEVISTVFGAVLFTLLVQGLLIKPLLSGLQLLGDQPMLDQYLEAIARQFALHRVLNHLQTMTDHPNATLEFCGDQTSLVQRELARLQTEIDQLLHESPNLQDFVQQQLQEELRAIEADTYAELVQSGRLKQELSPLL